MHVYDTLIVGSGYAAVGYAVANPNTLICEEQHTCDTAFYLTLPDFRYTPYVPKYEEGKSLLSCFQELSLFEGERQCTTAFECAFCKYILSKTVNIQLKSRVIDIKIREDGLVDAAICTNEGITHVLAKRVLRTEGEANERLVTVLVATDAEAMKSLSCAFPHSACELAFYDGRYAIHIPVPEDMDENTVKVWVYRRFSESGSTGRIIYIAPSFMHGGDKDYVLDDRNYQNPIEAFEVGYSYGKESAV